MVEENGEQLALRTQKIPTTQKRVFQFIFKVKICFTFSCVNFSILSFHLFESNQPRPSPRINKKLTQKKKTPNQSKQKKMRKKNWRESYLVVLCTRVHMPPPEQRRKYPLEGGDRERDTSNFVIVCRMCVIYSCYSTVAVFPFDEVSVVYGGTDRQLDFLNFYRERDKMCKV